MLLNSIRKSEFLVAVVVLESVLLITLSLSQALHIPTVRSRKLSKPAPYKERNDFFPNIRTLLIIVATIPVTTATPERTFSTLKLLKSYLRTTMGQDRLTGLALLYLHRSVNITVEEIIDAFARNRSRRIEFVL